MAVGCGRGSIQSLNLSVGNILFSGCSALGLNVLNCALLPMAALKARSRSKDHWLCSVSDFAGYSATADKGGSRHEQRGGAMMRRPDYNLAKVSAMLDLSWDDKAACPF